MDDELAEVGAPNCERCLLPMVVAGSADRPVWRCAECGLVRV